MSLRPGLVATGGALALLAGCAFAPARTPLAANPQAACSALAGTTVPASAIGIPSGYALLNSAVLLPASPLAVGERGATPAGTITPALPERCKVLGLIAPLDPKAPPIQFQVNLPTQWNGRSVQYGGAGFNGVLVSGEALVPAARYEGPTPLAQGYVTYGTDSGHQNKPGEPPQAFALNDEALVNFAHASYKKVRDVAVAVMTKAYGRGPQKMYFVGSSEGGREGLAMAQRYPRDFDGIFSRAPLIQWTGLQHVGLRDGLARADGTRLDPAQVQRMNQAVLGALADATNPDLSAFRAAGGKLILLENVGDPAQGPSAGLEYHRSVVQRLGRENVDAFFKAFTAPSVAHAGTGGPAHADLFPALVAWVEQGRAPTGLVLVEQDAEPPFAVKRSRPLCEWPEVPRYRAGNPNLAASFACLQ